MDKELVKMKQKYNYWLSRYKKAEEYFETATVEECEKHTTLFNEIVRNLSKLMIRFALITGRKMTTDEKFNGFSEV